MQLWTHAGGRADWNAYVESGQGMGPTLVMADQMQAYTLSDRGTYLAMRSRIALRPLAAQSKELLNPYGILVVNPHRHPRIRAELASRFVNFIVSPEAKHIIRKFRVHGEPLFHPLRLPALKPE